MKAIFQILGYFIVSITLAGVGGCSDPATDPDSQTSMSQQSDFHASVSGSVQGKVSGTGIVTYLPPKEGDLITGVRPGYFLIANFDDLHTDTAETKGFSIAFRIPEKARPGHYNLMSPDPLKTGEEFDVQVETMDSGNYTFYENNTEGTITLDEFSADPNNPDTSHIKGSFQFVSENRDGDRIVAKGTFAFPSRQEGMI